MRALLELLRRMFGRKKDRLLLESGGYLLTERGDPMLLKG